MVAPRAATGWPTCSLTPLWSGSDEVLLQEVDRPLPSQLGRGLVVARSGVVVEAVLRPRIGEHLVPDVVGLERGLVRCDASVDPLVVLGVVNEQRRLDVSDVLSLGLGAIERYGRRQIGQAGGQH